MVEGLFISAFHFNLCYHNLSSSAATDRWETLFPSSLMLRSLSRQRDLGAPGRRRYHFIIFPFCILLPTHLDLWRLFHLSSSFHPIRSARLHAMEHGKSNRPDQEDQFEQLACAQIASQSGILGMNMDLKVVTDACKHAVLSETRDQTGKMCSGLSFLDLCFWALNHKTTRQWHSHNPVGHWLGENDECLEKNH